MCFLEGAKRFSAPADHYHKGTAVSLLIMCSWICVKINTLFGYLQVQCKHSSYSSPAETKADSANRASPDCGNWKHDQLDGAEQSVSSL